MWGALLARHRPYPYFFEGAVAHCYRAIATWAVVSVNGTRPGRFYGAGALCWLKNATPTPLLRGGGSPLSRSDRYLGGGVGQLYLTAGDGNGSDQGTQSWHLTLSTYHMAMGLGNGERSPSSKTVLSFTTRSLQKLEAIAPC